MRAFFAYPSSQAEVRAAIHSAKEIVCRDPNFEINLWEENDITGRSLTAPIFSGIDQSQALIADITELNFNVTYEIGYAIGKGKRVVLTRNKNFDFNAELINKIGIFDTLGFSEYQDQESLAKIIKGQDDLAGYPLGGAVNRNTPLYLLQPATSNSALTHIVSKIKKSRLRYRSYMPDDDARLSAGAAIESVMSSIASIVPLIPSNFKDSKVHNIRAAFVSGLSEGMGKITLLMQPKGGPAPLDVRDVVRSFTNADDIGELIHELSLQVTEELQAYNPIKLTRKNFLQELTIGDPVAENEFQTLSQYYLQTDEFMRACRGEVNLVVGRKGAGKTALFAQLRDEKRSDRKNIVVDLKPEGYQLVRLKEDVLDYLAEGAKAHLITAFFEYVFYLEICYKVLEKDTQAHSRDARLYDPYQALKATYEAGAAGEGDFSERLLRLSRNLIEEFQERFGAESNQRLTAGQVTELVHKTNIREIRDALSRYLVFKGSVWVLFDNLDKGWPAHGIGSEDIVILRCLIDAARKIQREMRRAEHDFYCTVFVRNDVYQLLVDNSADYGKESRAVIDWADADLLREMLRLRLVSHLGKEAESIPFDEIWRRVCISHYNGYDTSQFLIDRSLMRPRNLIKLFAHCRSSAVGLGREIISEDDFSKGLHAYSVDLITEAEQELIDLLGSENGIIYSFIGEGDTFTEEKLKQVIEDSGADAERFEDIVTYMLYYGFLGVSKSGNEPQFIFDFRYDLKLLQAYLRKARGAHSYTMNPAFIPALNV